jgi:AcrR family transcriptional regulator
MRAVAENADVALGTLYRYFPSKIHLLVSGLAREFERRRRSSTASSCPARRRASGCCSCSAG